MGQSLGHRLILLVTLTQWGYSVGQHLACDNRNPEGHADNKQEGDGTFRIHVTGPGPNGTYKPNELYTVTIDGLSTLDSVKRFLEFLLVVESDKQAMMGESGLVTTGIFHVVDERLARFSDFCPDAVTNIDHRPKTEVSVKWTAPSVLVASCITFKATVVERPHVWYMDAGGLTRTVCPVVPVPTTIPTTTVAPVVTTVQELPRARIQPCCACDEAKYEVTFQGLWSKESHPKDFPENKWLLHFSDIIGASHDTQFFFWETGKLATNGLRDVAEWGATRILENELRAKQRHVNTIIKARGLWHPNEQGQTTGSFRVDPTRHLMSLVTMIGPSPDWFVGLAGYDLCTANCSWLTDASFDLYPYDAGSDNGVSYMAQNDRTVPAQVVRRITETNDTRSPFFDPRGSPMKPFAKLTLKRHQVFPGNCESTDEAKAREITVSENSEDVGRPECAVTEWSQWSDCSVTCDKGLRMRKRSYVLPPPVGVKCDRQLEETEMCLGVVPTCDTGGGGGEVDGVCAVTSWSFWTPCDHPCGPGQRTRYRRYKDHMGRKLCSEEMTQNEDCVGFETGCETTLLSTLAASEDPDCPVSPWSDYSPCSTSCGEGFRERTRFFLIPPNSPVPSKCLRIELSQNVSCVGEYGSCSLTMEEAKGICVTEPDPGPCRFLSQYFYFSVEKGMCVPFHYGGCKGNRNRFESETVCLGVCGFLSRTNDIELNEEQASTTTTTIQPVTTIEPQVEEDFFETIDDLDDEPIDCVVSKYSSWSICTGNCGRLGYSLRTREIIVEPRDGKDRPAQKCPTVLARRRACRVQC